MRKIANFIILAYSAKYWSDHHLAGLYVYDTIHYCQLPLHRSPLEFDKLGKYYENIIFLISVQILRSGHAPVLPAHKRIFG